MAEAVDRFRHNRGVRVAARARGGPWFSLAAGTLATAIPSAPGHVGTFDWFAAQGLEAYGASAEVAIAFALTVHAVLWVSSTAAGLFCLLAHGIRPWRVRGLLPVLGRRESSAPPTIDRPPAMPQTSAGTIQAGTAGEARCER